MPSQLTLDWVQSGGYRLSGTVSACSPSVAGEAGQVELSWHQSPHSGHSHGQVDRLLLDWHWHSHPVSVVDTGLGGGGGVVRTGR